MAALRRRNRPGSSEAWHRRRPGGPGWYRAATHRACGVTAMRASQGAASSAQATDRSLPGRPESSFPPLGLLSPPNPLRWASAGAPVTASASQWGGRQCTVCSCPVRTAHRRHEPRVQGRSPGGFPTAFDIKSGAPAGKARPPGASRQADGAPRSSRPYNVGPSCGSFAGPPSPHATRGTAAGLARGPHGTGQAVSYPRGRRGRVVAPYRVLSTPDSSLKALISSSSWSAWRCTSSHTVPYHRSLSSWAVRPCCSTQV